MTPKEVYVVEVTGGIHFRYAGKKAFNELDAAQDADCRVRVGFGTEADALEFVRMGDEVLQFVNCRPHYIRKP
jgi:hypothetical protein